FSGNAISGTPTQAGSFPITVSANDATGCPQGSRGYTLSIAGNAPASMAIAGGDPQSALPTQQFANPLQVIVRDGASNPLPGVGVTFTSPNSGASGTFSGGSLTAYAVTAANGIATAPAFTANSNTGSYQVSAVVVGLPAVNFNLTNG